MVNGDEPVPLNHVFVDFENIRDVDLDVIGKRAVSFTLLVGPQQKKLDAELVEKLFAHAASVQLVRLASSGKNALDFILTYYVGRAVAFDPTGCFHIISGDKGFDPLVKHLQGKRIDISRHESFAALPFVVPVKAAKTEKPAPVPVRAAAAKPKAVAKPKTPVPARIPDDPMVRVLEHLRKPSATHPKNKKRLVSYLVAYFGRKITEADALALVDSLRSAGYIAIDEKGVVSYRVTAGEV